MDGVPADGFGRFDQFDPGQFGRLLEQGFCRNADARGNGTPQVFPVRPQGTERSARTKVDDNQVALVAVHFMGSHCVHDPVSPDLGRIIIIQLQARLDFAGHHKRCDSKIPFAHVAQGHQQGRHHCGNDDILDILHIHAAVGKHAPQDNAEFIRSTGTDAGNPPMCLPSLAVMNAYYDIGIPNIHYHQHGLITSKIFRSSISGPLYPGQKRFYYRGKARESQGIRHMPPAFRARRMRMPRRATRKLLTMSSGRKGTTANAMVLPQVMGLCRKQAKLSLKPMAPMA